jgi:hypothetical protein
MSHRRLSSITFDRTARHTVARALSVCARLR